MNIHFAGRLFNRIGAFLASMTGRIFVILAVGMVAAALLAATITGAKSDREFRQQLIERAADRLESTVDLLDAIPAGARQALLGNSSGLGGIRILGDEVRGKGPDLVFQNALAERGPLVSTAVAQSAGYQICFPEIRSMSPEETKSIWESPEVQRALSRVSQRPARKQIPNTSTIIPPVCRIISIVLTDGTPLRFSLDTPLIERERSRFLDPAFIALLVLAVGLLAYLVARIASTPLHRLAANAAELGRDLDRPPIHVAGPTEVRSAAEAFNAMQQRLQQHVGERTQMLAAITHDLQTPLTRLRLRVETIEDEPLRERLIDDLAAMTALIEEGLELARSAETSEPSVMLDLDSLLASLVEDAAEAGGNAVFEHGCAAVLRLRPLAVRRLFSNLIDNAIQYGGAALVCATRAGHAVIVTVRDRGPGLPEDMLERAFDPFVRLDASRSRQSGGTGLGLTIARTLAQKSGAALTLRNAPGGGLEAIVQWANER